MPGRQQMAMLEDSGREQLDLGQTPAFANLSCVTGDVSDCL